MTKQESAWTDAPAPIRYARFAFLYLKEHMSGRSQKDYKILSMKDVKKEWDYIIKSVDKYLKKKDKGKEVTPTNEGYQTLLKDNFLSKMAVHFYHHPKDTERPFVDGNKKLIKKGFRILWVYNPDATNAKFEVDLTDLMGPEILKHCCIDKMDPMLKLIPVNFTVIAPHQKQLPLVYVRFEDLDCALRIESYGPTTLLFDNLGCYCLKKATQSDNGAQLLLER